MSSNFSNSETRFISEKDFNELLAKLKLTNSFPYTIPNTNIKICDMCEAEMLYLEVRNHKFFTYTLLGEDYWKDLLTQDISFIETREYVDDFNIPYKPTINKICINGKIFIYRIDCIDCHSKAYLSDDLIHILILDGSCKSYAFLALFRIDDFSMYGEVHKLKRRVNYPIFNIDYLQDNGLKQVGAYKLKR